MTRFILVRHAQTDALGRVLAGRAPGYGLNADGHAEAVRVALALSADPISRVLSSPRLRALQTAEPIASATGCMVEKEDTLDEIDFGAWNGQHFDTLATEQGWADWNTLRSLSPTPGGETMLQAQHRIVTLLQHLHTRFSGTACVLVSHADMIKAALSYALGTPLDLLQRIDIAPASISEITLSANTIHVSFVNRLA